MTPPASILVPTRARPSYLEVALASLRPQALAAGAQLVVVDDGPDDATCLVAERHGALYVAHASGRGLNAARTTAIAHATGDLLVFVDDDIEAAPGWLDALLLADRECPPTVGVLGGPIRARIEDHRFPMAGREGAPFTTLDLGLHDRAATFVWGANMAVRRTALDAVGGFDESLPLYGDEEEFQRRIRAAGFTVRYVAAAGVEHRRSGDDSRMRSLVRAGYRRGLAARRQDGARGSAPSLLAEAWTLMACLAHGPLHRCANGPVLAAHAAGRLDVALRPLPAAPTTATDFTSGASGTVGGRRGTVRRWADELLDLRLAVDPRIVAARRLAAEGPVRRIHVVGVARPGMQMDSVRAELARSRHDVTFALGAPGDRGKFENLNSLLAERPLDADWLLVVDDDIVMPTGFLDLFVSLAEQTGLRIAQPAHRLHSHAAWPVTRRAGAGRSLVRETAFVEIGPVTLLHRDTFGVLVPFPNLRMGWGLDSHWSAVARTRGWPIGVVDATPIMHLHPAAAGYDRAAALAEAQAFLVDRPYVRRDEAVTLRRLA